MTEYKKPNPESFINTCSVNNCYSIGDLTELNYKFSYIPIFVYGMEKFNFSSHNMLDDHPVLGYGYTASNLYRMYKKMKEHYPVILSGADEPTLGKIQGEVYLVPPKTLFDLDAMYENNVAFKRIRSMIYYCSFEEKDKKDKKSRVSVCWMYVGKRDFWLPKLQDMELSQMNLVVPDGGRKNTQYYCWKKLDDQPNTVNTPRHFQ